MGTRSGCENPFTIWDSLCTTHIEPICRPCHVWGDYRVNSGAKRSFYVENFLKSAAFDPVGRAAAPWASSGPIWAHGLYIGSVLSVLVHCVPPRMGPYPILRCVHPEGVH